MTPDDLMKFGLADDIISEKHDYSQDNLSYAVYKVSEKIGEYLKELSLYSGKELVARRYDKLLNMKGFTN